MICNQFSEPVYFLFSNGVPGLLYYSHIPTAVIALLVGFFVFWSGRRMLLNRLLFIIALCFSLWTFSNLILWTNIDSGFLLFVWTLYVVLFSFISISCVYFIYVFLEDKDAPSSIKAVFATLLAPILIFAPTYVNLSGFNITRCDAFGFEGWWYKAYYISLAIIAMVWILTLLVRKYRVATAEFRKQIVLMGIGIEFFLFSFFTITTLAGYLTDIGLLPDSSLEFYGLFGMTVFMIFIGILMVRFKTFHVNVIASQALIVALVVLIGSEFTFIKSTTNLILTSITLVLTVGAGFFLVRSVKREIQQREEIEQLAATLELANQRQESLLHFVGHEVKGFLTKDMGAFASLVEGDFGALPDTMKPFVEGALKQSRDGANSVIDILQASNQKKGTVDYKKEPFDFKALVGEWAQKLKPTAEAKGLAFNLSIDTVGDTCTVNGDRGQIGDHVLRNIIENSINYTPTGSITLSLAKADGKVILTVADTGVGINAEDKKRLFTEGGKGKDSVRINVHSTGYGLFIAKNIVDAHGGAIRAESEGTGKGSQFIIELPAA